MIDISKYENLVSYAVGKFHWARGGACTSPEDLAQAGRLGLIRAAETFDESRGVKFQTYAIYWVMQSVRFYARENVRTVRVPGSTAAKAFREKGERFPLRAVSSDAIDFESLGYSVEACDVKLEEDQTLSMIKKSLDILSSREERILRGVFFHDRTMESIGVDMGCSRERVRQIKERALSKIRKHLTNVSKEEKMPTGATQLQRVSP